MSRVRIGGAGGRRNVRPCRMQLQTLSVFRRVLKVMMIAELIVAADNRVPDSWCHDTECL